MKEKAEKREKQYYKHQISTGFYFNLLAYLTLTEKEALSLSHKTTKQKWGALIPFFFLCRYYFLGPCGHWVLYSSNNSHENIHYILVMMTTMMMNDSYYVHSFVVWNLDTFALTRNSIKRVEKVLCRFFYYFFTLFMF